MELSFSKSRLITDQWINLLYRLRIVPFSGIEFKDIDSIIKFIAKLNDGDKVDFKAKRNRYLP